MKVSFYNFSFLAKFNLRAKEIPVVGDFVVIEEVQYTVGSRCLLLDDRNPEWQIDMKRS